MQNNQRRQRTSRTLQGTFAIGVVIGSLIGQNDQHMHYQELDGYAEVVLDAADSAYASENKALAIDLYVRANEFGLAGDAAFALMHEAVEQDDTERTNFYARLARRFYERAGSPELGSYVDALIQIENDTIEYNACKE